LEAATQSLAPAATISFVSGLLRDFPDAFSGGKVLSVPVHNLEHHIKMTGPPIASRFWRLEGVKLEAAR
jgi:hypothetical protein